MCKIRLTRFRPSAFDRPAFDRLGFFGVLAGRPDFIGFGAGSIRSTYYDPGGSRLVSWRGLAGQADPLFPAFYCSREG